MKKKFLLTLLGILIGLPIMARNFDYTYEGNTLRFTVIDEKAETCKLKEVLDQWPDDLVIPSIAKDKSTMTAYTVVGIGSSLFYHLGAKNSLESVIIPNTVTEIEKGAFSGCSKLTSVSIPNSVTEIGENAFEGCSRLISVTIPDAVTSIKDNTFNGCSGLTSVTIPNSVTSIGGGAFRDCSSLTSVTIPNSVTSIGGGAFRGCSGMASVTIPNSVTSIGSGTFEGCSGLTKAEFSSIEHLCSIDFLYFDDNPLYYAHNLWIDGKEVTELVIPESVTKIGTATFSGCSGLTSVTIPNSVTSIGDCSFRGCSGLTSVTIPNSVTSIEGGAFSECSGLLYVFIPPSVGFIYHTAFYNCDSILRVALPYTLNWEKKLFSTKTYQYEYNVNPSTNSLKSTVIITKDNYILSKDGKELLYVPYVENGDYAVPDGVTVISFGAFADLYNVTNIIIPDGVTKIGNYAFRSCTNLESVVFSDSVSEIGEYAFASCTGMEYLHIPDNVTTIGSSAFSECRGLKEVTLPQNLEYLGSEAFTSCRNIKDVVYRGTTPVERPNYYDKSVFQQKVYENATLHVPSGCKDSFSKVVPWKFFFNISDAPFSAVEEVIADEDGIDYTLPYDVYNLKGQMTGNSVEGLVPGMYIVRQGSKVKKLVVK